MKDLSLKELIEHINSKKITSKEVWDYFQERITKYNDKINAFVFINQEGFSQNLSSPLAGIPLGIKDLFSEKNIPTTAASAILQNFKPPYNAQAISLLKTAGFSSLGKVNTDEFAMGGSTKTSFYGVTKNPWNQEKIPGGSSGGSAAAVSAGLAPASLATDTGGSIRQPASFCNVVGFKPSYGRVSRYGTIPLASSLDTIGFITKTVQDAGLLYEITNGEDEKENTTIAGKDILSKDIWKKQDLSGYTFGIPKEYFGEELSQEIREVIEENIKKIESLGGKIQEISLPHTHPALGAYYTILSAETSTNLGRIDGLRYGTSSQKGYDTMDDFYKNSRGEGFGPEVQMRSILGAWVLSEKSYDTYYTQATKIRTLIREDFQKAFQEVDIILAPVTPNLPNDIAQEVSISQGYTSDIYTVPSSLAGLPAISIPAGFTQNMPVGLQMIGAQFADQKVLQVANVFEQATQYGKKNPEGFEEN